MDWQSDPYVNQQPNFYNLKEDWAVSDYNRAQMFVFSSLYQLPFGRNKAFLNNAGKLVQTLAGDWNVGGIITLNSGAPFFALAGGDIANTGGPSQRAQRTGANPV